MRNFVLFFVVCCVLVGSQVCCSGADPVKINPFTPPTASDIAISDEKEVDLELYYQSAGFNGSDRNFKTLLKEGTAQLRARMNELEKKYNAADEFDRPAIKKQVVEIETQARAKREEIQNKTFFKEYADCSPYDVQAGENYSSFALNVGKGFYPFKQGFGQFVSPFPNMTAEMIKNEYDDDISSIVARQTNEFRPAWTSIRVFGDTESIKTIVRGMKDNPKHYSLKLWFTELGCADNERVGLDLSNPFGARRWTEFIVVAKIVKIQIVDKTNETVKYYTVGQDAGTDTKDAKNRELEGKWQLFFGNGKKAGGVYTVRYDKVKEQYEMLYSQTGYRFSNIQYDGKTWSYDECEKGVDWKNIYEKVDDNAFVGSCIRIYDGKKQTNQKMIRIRE